MNLIPEKQGWQLDYFCTWSAQTRWALPVNVNLNALEMRDRMSEDFLFGEKGLLHAFDPDVRGELAVVLDDGWDVPVGSYPQKDITVFGSLIVDADKFPSCTGTPQERLQNLSDRVKALGYAGLGLWVAVQLTGVDGETELSDEQIYAYWAERARWCQAADVCYWKCDWGNHSTDVRFRRLMTQAVRDHAPDLMIEHFYPVRGPLDSELPEDDKLRGNLKVAKEVFPVSDALRTYDVALEFSASTTLNRVSLLAKQGFSAPEGRSLSLLNIEDALYLAPGCGGACGVMRVPLKEYDPRMNRSGKLTELKRVLAWHRIAPPFCPHGVEYRQSDERLSDRYDFPEDFRGWPDTHGQTVCQSAPAAMSFGIDLPAAQPDSEGLLPYIIASRHPQNGASALCALPRTLPGWRYHMPLCALSLTDLDAACPVGLFGEMKSVRLSFRQSIEGRRVLVQDLAAAEVVDLTEQAIIQGNELLLSGDLLARLCAANQPSDDFSSPAVVLKLL